MIINSIENIFKNASDTFLDSTKDSFSFNRFDISKTNLSFKNSELRIDEMEETEDELLEMENRPPIYKDFLFSYLKDTISSPLDVETETGNFNSFIPI